MLRLVAKRLLMLPPSLLVIITFAFLLIEIMPGDPAVAIAGDFARPEELEQIREELGLDKSLPERYWAYVVQTMTGDLGTSFFTGRSILDEIIRRLPDTMELVILALLLSALIGLVIGGVSAYYARIKAVDQAGRTAITAIQSVPDFLLALFLIYTLFFIAGVAPPPVGRMGLIRGDVERITGFLLIDSLVTGGFDAFVQAVRQLMLPVLALGIFYSAYFAKTARSTLIEALRSDQVEFARACGLPERTVFRYALLQSRTPILTYGAILLGALVGGAAIVEIIFSWQGVGQWALEAILQLDMPAIQGFIIAAGVITILVYLVLDVLVMWLDPRVEY